MSEKDKVVYIDIPREESESLIELTEFIENELKPPSRTYWLLLYFMIGLAGGLGLGGFISWWLW